MVVRWTLSDPYLNESYTFPYNPQEMRPIFPVKNMLIKTTTAIDGQALLFEGNPERREWSFSGVTLDRAHHEELKRWSEKRHRVRISDHFGREFDVYLVSFESVPRNKSGWRWYHEYTMNAIILTNPTDPTVSD